MSIPAPPTRRARSAIVAAAALTVAGLPAVASAAPPPVLATVRPSSPVAITDQGRPATVGLTLTTPTGRPLSAPVTVRYATGAGSATAGADYTAAAGTVTFPAGTASGTTRPVAVGTRADAAAETAETVPLTVTGPAGVTTGGATVVIAAHGLPYLNAELPVAARVRDLLRRMTLEEKVGQMTQAERSAVDADPSLISTWRLGSLLSGGGSTPTPNTPEAWADMVDTYQSVALATRLQIPIVYGVDSVHGHGNLVGATIFPHNIGLGSTRDPKLVEQVEHVTAKETRATGPQWAFAPCVCVARDTRWGRTYESFGEDPSLVIAMETSIDGLQGPRGSQLSRPDRVLASTKHYAGDGDTEYGTGSGDYPIDQGVTVTSRADFERIDLRPYEAAVRQHRTGTIMPSYSSVDWTEDGVGNPTKMHASRELLTDVLKGDLGFDGFLISDYNAIDQIPGDDFATKVRVGVNAGTDMFMQPNNYQDFETTLLAEVNAGRVSRARVDDAVSRILTQKFELGLFERPFTDRTYLGDVGSAQHRAVARKAAAESQVLLKNSGNVLPLERSAKVYVAGRNADDIGNQAGGWTVQWQGVSGDSIPGTTVLEGIRQVAPTATYSEDGTAPTAGADVGVVVVGETPYAEGFGDVGGPTCNFCTPDQTEQKSLTLNAADSATVDRVCSAIAKCVVLVVSGRPQVFDTAKVDGLVASWLPGSEGAGVADVLFGARPFTGRLSQTWPATAAQEPINVGDAAYDPAYPFGWGLRTDPARARLVAARDQATGAARADLTRALRPAYWSGNTVRDKAAVVAWLTRAAGELARSDRDGFAVGDAVVSVVRDLAQSVAGAGRAPANAKALHAQADVQLLNGRPDQAITTLIRAGALR